MANPEHLKILKQGVETWNQWRKDNPEVTPDLGEALLRGTNLSKADLIGATLSKANLSGANLSEA
ncbi:MAG: pentapeptide repeat-containing protein, partial [Blastocatellia bacterium]